MTNATSTTKAVPFRYLEKFSRFEEGLTIREQSVIMGIRREVTYWPLIHSLEALIGQDVVARAPNGKVIERCQLTPAGRDLRRHIRWYYTVKREAEAQYLEYLEKLSKNR